MNPFAWLGKLFAPKSPPPSIPIDEQPGILGDIARLGEAAGGDAQAAEGEQQIADGTKP
jgi:hypothetical protein